MKSKEGGGRPFKEKTSAKRSDKQENCHDTRHDALRARYEEKLCSLNSNANIRIDMT
jgi:hypothetical protein